MLFNSLSFLLFLPIVFVLYWFVFGRDFRRQNLLLLLASYVFYGWWDWRFLFLLIFSTGLDFYTGLRIHDAATPARRKTWMWISVGANLGFLGFFKYYNFFADSFAALLHALGLHADPWTLDIILPVGISFYTFHGLSYVIDIYKGRISPSRDWVNYCVFVSYFPLLVAGPIERATHLLPQIERPRRFDYRQAVDGLRLMLWGFAKKVLIADALAPLVGECFDTGGNLPGATLLIGAVLFSIQIYGDFSGYSDIARGVSRFFGIELLLNFNFPYLSRSIPEFWRRWHISLSSWFRDYLYIPLGGSRAGKWRSLRNVFAIFTVSGFWHGADWKFIAWGAIHALLFIPSFLAGRNRQDTDEGFRTGRWYPSAAECLRIASTFALVTLAWVFFRAASISDAAAYIGGIFQGPFLPAEGLEHAGKLLLVPLCFGMDLLQRAGWLTGRHGTAFLVAEATILILAILIFGSFGGTEFIYFQF